MQKVRSRASEVATQAIEDLQRSGYDSLGLCASPTSSPPSGLSDIAYLPNRPSPASATYGEDPCSATPDQVQVPESSYTCTPLNTSYAVSRYVSWNDGAYTIKRLAVFVDWTDAVHPVGQRARVDAEVMRDLGDGLAGLLDDPDSSLPELRIEPPSCLWHGISS